MKNLVPIGRFAVVARLSVKALRHYDELGLLRPALVDPASGYRYYAAAQAVDADRIRLLRALEVPLDEIAAILRERTPEAVRARLERHRERLEARVEEDRRRIAALVRLCEEETMTIEVVMRSVDAQAVLSLRERRPLAGISDGAAAAFNALFGYLSALGGRPAGPPLAIYHGAPDDAGVVDVEWCVPTGRVLAGHGPLAGRELEAATAACVRHEGPYEEIAPCYAALAAWIQERGHESAGSPREVYLVSPGPGVAPADFRTEIQWPVR